MTTIEYVAPSPNADRGDPRPVVQAIWAGQVLAASTRTLQVNGIVYFPPEDVRREFLTESATTRVSLSFGQAAELDVTVDGQTHPGAAWYWPPPSPLARHLPGHIAFGGQTQIVREVAPAS